ncbi:hypothetical protein ACOZ0N_003155 [Cronobacter muytjensii]
MSEITQDRLDRIVETADEILSALAGKNEDVHPDDSKKMCQLWDELNDSLAPPEVVKAIVLELSELRKEREAAVSVYQMRLIDGTEDQTIWVEVSNEEFNTPLKNPDEWERRILYATPPAQPVAVPNELAARHAYESHVKSQYQYPMLERHSDDAGPWSGEYKEATRQLAWEDWLKSWNACRAAMLAAPGKPVAVPDDVLTRLAWNIAVSFADEETKKDKELFHKLINHAVDDCRSQMLTTQGKPVALPDEMTPEMMRAVQTKSELGAHAAANLTGAYDLFSEFWRVACQAATPAAPGKDV